MQCFELSTKGRNMGTDAWAVGRVTLPCLFLLFLLGGRFGLKRPARGSDGRPAFALFGLHGARLASLVSHSWHGFLRRKRHWHSPA